MPGKCTRPLGRIDLPVCFGTPSNYRKEVLTFEVVGFKGTYHAILGRPCYAKFMAVPNYTYLKLKMSGPAEALVEAETLIVNLDRLGSEAPDSKRRAGTFEPTEAIKLVPVDPACPDDQALRISATLDIK